MRRLSEQKRSTAGLKVVSRRKYGEEANVIEYLFSVTGNDKVERRNYLIEFHYTRDVKEYGYENFRTGKYEVHEPARKKGDYRYERRTETRQKFLCLCGPLNGKRATAHDAPEYAEYNAAGFNRGTRSKDFRVVLIHQSILKEGK